jgi:membrane-associated phospholipid phosphatase
MRGFSVLGSLAFVMVASLISFVIFRRVGRPQEAMATVWAVGGAMVLENILKYTFHRARPPEPFFGTAPHSYSFPSGHALFSFWRAGF